MITRTFLSKFTRNLVVATTLWVGVIGGYVTTQTVGHADESITRIGQNAQLKQQAIASLKKRIARHKRMTTAEIFADLRKALQTTGPPLRSRRRSTLKITIK